ncbi:carbon-nitrogen family hydrolase [Intrasporangium sp.]|uniref:carbon-nitrogen family hydrolase n=1 Tax=Intrasporangium sp. TaxID=1925024 RepID=UPI00293A2ADE|nr:carbon-nitrogen family hydrolase [Intrasporangium sp.]MDV3221382.1 carbon-nitrogen family hydrolase [Intrasporangium sp.]
MKVAVIQLAYGDGETVTDRTARVVDLVRAQAGHDLVVLPELWPAGGFDYRAWDDRAESIDGPIAQSLAAAARDAGVTLHGGSIVERAEPTSADGHGVWNTSLVFSPEGELVATYRKIHRFGFGEGEPTLMDAGDDLVVVDVPVAPVASQGEEPLPDTTGRTDAASSVAVGLSTCYDLRFPELYRALLDRGAEVFVVPAAWPAKRVAHWTLLGQARAIENQCVVIQCNTAGTHAGHEMGGHSQVVDATGTVLATAGHHEEVLSVEFDTGATHQWRQAFPVLADRRLR